MTRKYQNLKEAIEKGHNISDLLQHENEQNILNTFISVKNSDKEDYYTLLTYAILKNNKKAVEDILVRAQKLGVLNQLLNGQFLNQKELLVQKDKYLFHCKPLELAKELNHEEITKIIEQKIKEVNNARTQNGDKIDSFFNFFRIHSNKELMDPLIKAQQDQLMELCGTGVGTIMIGIIIGGISAAIEMPVYAAVCGVAAGLLILVGVAVAIYGFKEAYELETSNEPRADVKGVNANTYYDRTK